MPLLLVLAASGCGTPGPTPVSGQAPRIELDTQIRGRVAVVNPTLRFVVIDFGLRPHPPVDRILGLFRNEQRIGEVRLTGPSMGQTMAADIIEGEARIGDEARER